MQVSRRICAKQDEVESRAMSCICTRSRELSKTKLGSATGLSQILWSSRLVRHSGRTCASDFGGPHDPERHRRPAEAPGQGGLQGPTLRGGADHPSRLLVPALPAELPRHRGVVPGAWPGGGPFHTHWRTPRSITSRSTCSKALRATSSG